MTDNLQEFSWNGLKLKYDFRQASRDTRHLIVFFSGYRSLGTFDFHGSSAANLKASVLWIEDWFDGNHAYYIHSKNSGLKIADAVQSLIEKFRIQEHLEKTECTLAGFSKGASGALYHALKYDYKNVIAAAPRMNMGTANRKRHPDVFHNMAPSDTQEGTRYLDRLIPDLLSSPNSFDKNIYLFSSPADYQYSEEIEPFLSLYSRFSNFNFFRTDSPLVIEHRNVTGYNVGLINSILVCCSEGLAPRFNQINGIGDRSRLREGKPIPKALEKSNADFGVPCAGFTTMRLSKNDLEARGWGIVIGNSAKQPNSISSTILLRSQSHRYSIKTIAEKNPKLNADHFKRAFIDYSFGGFRVDRDHPTPLRSVVPGVYDVQIQTEGNSGHNIVKEFNFVPNESPTLISDNLYFLRKIGNKIRLHVLPMGQKPPHSSHFELNNFWLKGNLFHADGIFAIEGRSYAEWDDVNNYILLINRKTHKIDWVGQIAKDRVKGVVPQFDDPWNDYGKSAYATRGYKGVAIPEEIIGSYEIFISQFDNHGISTRPLGLTLEAHEKVSQWKLTRTSFPENAASY